MKIDILYVYLMMYVQMTIIGKYLLNDNLLNE